MVIAAIIKRFMARLSDSVELEPGSIMNHAYPGHVCEPWTGLQRVNYSLTYSVGMVGVVQEDSEVPGTHPIGRLALRI